MTTTTRTITITNQAGSGGPLDYTVSADANVPSGKITFNKTTGTNLAPGASDTVIATIDTTAVVAGTANWHIQITAVDSGTAYTSALSPVLIPVTVYQAPAAGVYVLADNVSVSGAGLNVADTTAGFQDDYGATFAAYGDSNATPPQFGIASHQAYLANTNANNLCYYVADTGHSDVEVSATYAVQGAVFGVAGRVTDAAHALVAYHNSGTLHLAYTNGSATSLTDIATASYTPANGDTVKLVISGIAASVSVNGTQKIAAQTIPVTLSGTQSGIVTNSTTNRISACQINAPAVPANNMIFSTAPGTTAAGDTPEPAIAVTLRDAGNATVTAATATVSLAISNPGALTGTTQAVATNGVATFPDTLISPATPVGSYTVTATTPGVAPITSASFTVQSALTYAVMDRFTGANGTNLTAHTPNTRPGSNAWTSLAGTVTIQNNQATSSNGGSLYVIDSGLTNGTVSALVYNAAGTNQIVFRCTDANNLFYCQVSPTNVQVVKVASGSFSTVGSTYSATAVAGDLYAIVLNGSSLTVCKNGAAIITGTDSFNSSATKHGLRSTTTLDNFQVSTSVAVPLTVATHLAFSQQPVATGKGLTFTTLPKVQALNASNVVDTAYTGTVTLAITSGTGGTGGTGAALSGTVSVACVAGVADFSSAGLSINKGGTGFQLHATSGTLTATDSSAFDVASVYADFTGADSATAMVNPGTGQTWTVQVGGPFKNASNQAKLDTGSEGQATVDSGSANGYTQGTIVNATSADGGFMFRYQDNSNFWLMRNLSGNTDLYLRSGGAYTLKGQVAGAANGDVLKAVYSGSSITIYRNGTSIITVTDSTLSTQTLVGLRGNSATVLWDTFESIPA